MNMGQSDKYTFDVAQKVNLDKKSGNTLNEFIENLGSGFNVLYIESDHVSLKSIDEETSRRIQKHKTDHCDDAIHVGKDFYSVDLTGLSQQQRKNLLGKIEFSYSDPLFGNGEKIQFPTPITIADIRITALPALVKPYGKFISKLHHRTVMGEGVSAHFNNHLSPDGRMQLELDTNGFHANQALIQILPQLIKTFNETGSFIFISDKWTEKHSKGLNQGMQPSDFEIEPAMTHSSNSTFPEEKLTIHFSSSSEDPIELSDLPDKTYTSTNSDKPIFNHSSDLDIGKPPKPNFENFTDIDMSHRNLIPGSKIESPFNNEVKLKTIYSGQFTVINPKTHMRKKVATDSMFKSYALIFRNNTDKSIAIAKFGTNTALTDLHKVFQHYPTAPSVTFIRGSFLKNAFVDTVKKHLTTQYGIEDIQMEKISTRMGASLDLRSPDNTVTEASYEDLQIATANHTGDKLFFQKPDISKLTFSPNN